MSSTSSDLVTVVAADPLAILPAEQRALVQLMIEQAEMKKQQAEAKQRLAITEDKVALFEAKQQALEEGSKSFWANYRACGRAGRDEETAG